MSFFMNLIMSRAEKSLRASAEHLLFQWIKCGHPKQGCLILIKELDEIFKNTEKQTADHVASLLNSGKTLDSAILPSIAQICAELLVSEEYSIGPGILNPLGPGPELLGIFCWALDKMVEIEFIGADFAKNKRIELLSLIDFRYMLRDIDIKSIPINEKQAIRRLIGITNGKTPEGAAVNRGELGKDAQYAFVWIRDASLLKCAQVNERLDLYLQMERHGELSQESAIRQHFLTVFGGILTTGQGISRITHAIELAERIAAGKIEEIFDEEMVRVERRCAMYWNIQFDRSAAVVNSALLQIAVDARVTGR